MQTLIVAWPPPSYDLVHMDCGDAPFASCRTAPRAEAEELSWVPPVSPGEIQAVLEGKDEEQEALKVRSPGKTHVDMVTKHCRLVHLPPERLLLWNEGSMSSAARCYVI